MPKTPRIEPDGDVVARLAATALALPETYEEDAWTGVRWRIRAKTFAHVMVAQAGYESSFRDITGIPDPTPILTFHATGDELLALVNAGRPFYKPPWSPTIVGHGARRRPPTGTRWPSWSPRATGSAPRRSWCGSSTDEFAPCGWSDAA